MGTNKKRLKTSRKRSGAREADKPARLSPGEWFEKLVTLQARLRARNGCPWDREQTHTTLRTYLVEEAYEVLDALQSGDDAKFANEMGDLLLQIVFHSQIAAEEGRFTVADVIREVHEKMVRRHPHVFGEKRATHAAGYAGGLAVDKKSGAGGLRLGRRRRDLREDAGGMRGAAARLG